ncbi:kinesin-like protein Klp10A [Sitophilus oryzae]|uniref:Kinesin-like protein n=1 Tax=Sitophilus oryzae TaxID=7048 RepID=A0A6J2XJU0_SITOR|nr:kinesin-like protein Klp10A [Sitophilus oryzae]
MTKILSIGDSITIKRTNGALQEAIVSDIDYDLQCIKVEWYENDDTKGKEIHFVNVQSLNPQYLFEPPSSTSQIGLNQSETNVEKNRSQARRTKATNCDSLKDYGMLNVEGRSIAGARTTRSAVESNCKQKNSVTLQRINKLERERLERRTKQAKMKAERHDIMKKTQDNPYWKVTQMIGDFRDRIDTTNKHFLGHDTPSDHLITVAVRKRPINDSEIKKNEIDIITVPNKHQIIVHEPKHKVDLTKYLENHTFKFDCTLNEFCSNETVYKFTAQPLVKCIFEGGYATCFAYGQTGSGKTYTMSGDTEYSEPGIYTLTAKDIFKNIQSNKYRHCNFMVSCSFFEIYVKKVYDLLNLKEPLKILEDGQQQVQIVGLTEQVVYSVDDVLELIYEGNKTRTFGHTSANTQSSRSHAIFQFYLRTQNTTNIHGKFSLIDLAGNERGADTFSASKTTRLESAEINQSLLSLKECIRALGRKDGHLPFRGSKLTQVLRDSFVGTNSKTCMIAMISPGIGSCENTLNTLRYANRVKELSDHNSSKDKYYCERASSSESRLLTVDKKKKDEHMEKQNRDMIRVFQKYKKEAELLLDSSYMEVGSYYCNLNTVLTDAIASLIKIKDSI